MKIILVGATGTIGKHVYKTLSSQHDIIKASRHRGEVKVDMTSADSIKKMYEAVGDFDALICAAGNAHFGVFDEMKEDDFYKGIRSKMMGQINLVMIGKEYINDGGSFTLTTGILSEDPIRMGVGLSMVNGAVNAFAMAAAIELKRGIRINVVSPGMVEDSLETYGPYFPGHIPVPMWKAVSGYVKSVEGAISGEIIKIYG